MLSATEESYMSHLQEHSGHRAELIIFDCDGMLIDSEMIATTALSAALIREIDQ